MNLSSPWRAAILAAAVAGCAQPKTSTAPDPPPPSRPEADVATATLLRETSRLHRISDAIASADGQRAPKTNRLPDRQEKKGRAEARPLLRTVQDPADDQNRSSTPKRVCHSDRISLRSVTSCSSKSLKTYCPAELTDAPTTSGVKNWAS